ncbi:Bifunctional hemolysin/adenylate cyclase [Sphingobium sp. CECT 9361]|nr:Bifunctional hemolysin/adenylate cyclase [Sphingobium sp. CECT 9361]|tara:strand:+ start:1200 stop:2528 length:1329 start_codon:yes stop_codon:yes gene_type:complete
MAIILGTAGPDNLLGTADADVIEGLGGNDEITGRDGRDELYGGDGNDIVNGYSGSFFHETDAILSGGDGDDILQFTDGNTVIGTEVPITLIDGGSGVDTAVISSSFDSIINLSDPSIPQTFYAYVNTPREPFYGVTLVNIERLVYRGNSSSFGDDITGGALDDEISGGRADDILQGGGGDDILRGDDGRDTLLGGDGNDYLSLGLGDILVDGGDGIDSIHFSGYYPASETMIFSLADPTVEQTLLGATVRNVESISAYSYGTRGDDVVTGGAFADVFSGWSGNDIIRGGGGNDELDGDIAGFGAAGNDEVHGDAGSDRITGGGGDDILYGGSDGDRLNGDGGNDRLVGGQGADQLFGGSGADVFVFAPGDVSLAYGMRDQIYDFEVGIDQLDLSAFTGATVTLVAGAYTRVKIDFDGDLKTDALIQVETVDGAALTMGDLLL